MSANSPRKLWFLVFICAAVIVVLWATIFYPASLRLGDNSSQQHFSEFKNRINNALSVFKNKKSVEATKAGPEDDIQDLRSRVFGDAVKR